jgi:hypothetical protein
MSDTTDSRGPAPGTAGGDGSRTYRGDDRRTIPTRRLTRFSFWGGRRHRVRRQDEREGSFVDRYSTRLWFMILWVSLMNVGDSYFTLVHLQGGGIELNPVAAFLLETGRARFVLYKTILIGLALIVLCVHKNFFLARVGLWLATAAYTVLVVYHLSLFR